MVAIWNGTAWRYIAATTPTNGTVLQTVVTETTTALSATNQDVLTFWFQASITPKSASSKIYVRCDLNGIQNGGSGRVVLGLRYNTTSGGTTGTNIGGTFFSGIAQNSTGTNGVSSAAYAGLVSLGTTSTNYFKVVAQKGDSNTTWDTNIYGTSSSMTLMEIAG
jgi:hypothetical protein